MALSFGLSLISEAITAGGASLNLPLAGATALDSRVTFTRGSNATMVGSDGLLQYAPHNLLLQSEDFSNASWAKFGTATVTPNTAVAPDGTMTADTLSPGTGGIYQAATATALTTYVFPIYVRADAATNSRLVINTNLSDPVLQSIAVTTEWQRFQISKTTSTGTTSITAQIDNGAGSNNVYIWGAQLNVGALQPYYPTTSAAYYGPRLVYDPVTLAAQGLLVEEQRTNLCLQSKDINYTAYPTLWQFSNGPTPWAPVAAVTAPDGTLTAQQYSVVVNANAYTAYQAMTVTASTVYTWMLYVKLGTLPVNEYLIAFRDDTNGAFIAVDIAPTLVSVGNGWSRLTYTLTTPAGCVSMRCYPFRNTGPSIGGTISFWGAQLEAGAFATSYIPTTTAQATRAADVATMTGTNFSSWYNQTEGTFVINSTSSAALSGFPTSLTFSDGSQSNKVQAYIHTSGVYSGVASGNVGQGDIGVLGAPVAGTQVKFASAIAVNSAVSAWNGVLGDLDTALTMPVGINQLRIGAMVTGAQNLNGTIRSITYYPRRLSNTELQALTS